jgi:hypothetical protein
MPSCRWSGRCSSGHGEQRASMGSRGVVSDGSSCFPRLAARGRRHRARREFDVGRTGRTLRRPLGGTLERVARLERGVGRGGVDLNCVRDLGEDGCLACQKATKLLGGVLVMHAPRLAQEVRYLPEELSTVEVVADRAAPRVTAHPSRATDGDEVGLGLDDHRQGRIASQLKVLLPSLVAAHETPARCRTRPF